MTMLTIPASENFVMALARYCQTLSDEKNIPLSDLTLYLPTRRSVRALKACFSSLSNGQAQFLPLMQSIGDADLEQVDMVMSNISEIPNPIDPMHRQIALARLLEKTWPHDYSYQQSLSIATDLGRLIDQIHTENLDIQTLAALIDKVELAEYWSITSDFLMTLLGQIWPQYLDDINMIDPGLYRHLGVMKLAEFYKSHPPQKPTIIAGSTGSIPATRTLIKTLYEASNGFIVLPALDHQMSEDEWFAVGEGHCQYLLKNLLSLCNVKRQDVSIIQNTVNNARETLISKVMLPAEKTDTWKNLSMPDQSDIIKNGLNGVTLCNADHDEQEAMAIALAMMEIAADPKKEKTCVLVTPDTSITKRVQSILATHGITADNSMGTPLIDMPISRYLLNIIRVLDAEKIQIIPLLNTLKNPSMGYLINNQSRATTLFETALCRKYKIRGGFDNYIKAAETLDKETQNFIQTIKMQFQPLLDLQTSRQSVKKWITAHITVAQSFAQTKDDTGENRLWGGRLGDSLATLFEKIMDYDAIIPPMTMTEYADFITHFLSKETITAVAGTHPRLSILGQIEARMVKADRVILAGLNEGIWPPDSGFDVWMSRAMRGHFGLPSLEQKTSLAAHDFYCGFCAGDVMITRSEKSGGQPTLKSRWLERMETVITAANINDKDHPAHKGEYYKSLARTLRHTDGVQTYNRPAPCPSIDKRPTDYSVTEIEKFMRDPYWIYAKKILGLYPLDTLDDDVTVADRGNIIHNVLEVVNTQYDTADIPDNFTDILITHGRDIFDKQPFNTDIHGLWWPRFKKTAQWVASHEKEWRTGTDIIYNEQKSTLTIPINTINFTLTGKIDRIESRHDNHLAIIDYKTGLAPAPKDIMAGLSSQLSLEAMMIEKSAFAAIPYHDNHFSLYYWVLNGSGEGGSVSQVKYHKNDDITPLIQQAEDGVRTLFETFARDDIPYYATPDPDIKIKPEYNDFAHLQRIKEWLVQGEDD